ncbi:hypothetical protein [Winogradskyella flava]|uniref:DUF1579 domain-containing protein n=1 Tax=Winogradskyella flava TaxID=1884876 RepID=A0A842IRK6_9FLAO|nr:hypothetical protein [Winogradskyella flava]MBC2844077.1 hypothetical protein [Winogradskyella flava]
MIKTKTYLVLFLMPLLVWSQDNKLDGFDNLVDKTWIAKGEWSNGYEFKQEVSYNYDLNKMIVVAKSKGFTNEAQTEYGSRNHGIRKYDAEKDTIEFWEFDVFGGVTQGTVEFKDMGIFYHCKYGKAMVSDCWEYVDDRTYKFTLGSYKDGQWKAVYLQAEFKLKEE